MVHRYCSFTVSHGMHCVSVVNVLHENLHHWQHHWMMSRSHLPFFLRGVFTLLTKRRVCRAHCKENCSCDVNKQNLSSRRVQPPLLSLRGGDRANRETDSDTERWVLDWRRVVGKADAQWGGVMVNQPQLGWQVYPDWPSVDLTRLIKSKWQFANYRLLMVELRTSPPLCLLHPPTGPVLHTIHQIIHLSVPVYYMVSQSGLEYLHYGSFLLEFENIPIIITYLMSFWCF